MKLFKINIQPQFGVTPMTFFVMEMLGRRTALVLKDLAHQPSNEYVTLDNMLYISSSRTLVLESPYDNIAKCMSKWLYEIRGDVREQRDAIIARGFPLKMCRH